MYKPSLIHEVGEILASSGFTTVECLGSRSSFDLVAKKKGKVLLVKVLSNVEGLSRPKAIELKHLSSILDAVPLVIAERMKNSRLSNSIVYDRYGVHVLNPYTLREILDAGAPKAYSKRGNYLVQVDRQRLVDARKRLGLTQEALADKLGISKQSVYRYESSGSISLDIFDKILEELGEDLLTHNFDFFITPSAKREREVQRHTTALKDHVLSSFENMGFTASLTNAPFDIVASEKKRVFSVVSNDWRRLEEKVTTLEEITDVLGGYTVCVSERRVKTDMSVLSPSELSEIETAKQLFKLLREK